MLDLSAYKVVDLSISLHSQIAGFSSEIAKTIENDGWNASMLHIYSHTATHMDAPLHFNVSQRSIDQYPVERLIGNSFIVDIKIERDRQLLMVNDLGSLQYTFEEGSNLILRTGWIKHLGTTIYRDGLPRISEELASWCVEHKVNILGVEPPSVADVNDLQEVTHIHEILLAGDVIILEGLANLEKLSKDRCTLIALPLKFKGGDGAPARVIALESLDS